jgi:light-regulated signal transduction histidine kinase (bacteriophytochrome)
MTGQASLELLERRLAREHKARLEAEAIAEQVTAQLYTALQDVQATVAQLTHANEALERTNLDLQHFAHVASHDLQTPLRAIIGYAQFIEQDLEGKLDEQTRDHLHRMRAAVRRMQTLIDDLTRFVLADSRPRPFVECELDGVLERAPLPRVVGDPVQIAQVFEQLLRNALLYQRDGAAPRIAIGARAEDDDWIISVQDNGIGIEQRHFARIFEPLRRLHTQNRYPGSGIGLALCRRIVGRHGGSIGVESEPDRGSTFWFTLPRGGPVP